MSDWNDNDILFDEPLDYQPRSRILIHAIDDARWKKLMDVLKELTDQREHNYIDWYWDDCDVTSCLYCGKTFLGIEPEQHEENCPVLRGKRLVESLEKDDDDHS